MSETTPSPQPGGQAPQQPLVVNIQYVKDLSFEVPGAPQIFTQLRDPAPGQHQPGCPGPSGSGRAKRLRGLAGDPGRGTSSGRGGGPASSLYFFFSTQDLTWCAPGLGGENDAGVKLVLDDGFDFVWAGCLGGNLGVRSRVLLKAAAGATGAGGARAATQPDCSAWLPRWRWKRSTSGWGQVGEKEDSG